MDSTRRRDDGLSLMSVRAPEVGLDYDLDLGFKELYERCGVHDPVALDLLSLKELEAQRRAANAPKVKPNPDLYDNAALLWLGVANTNQIDIELHKIAGNESQALQEFPMLLQTSVELVNVLELLRVCLGQTGVVVFQ